MTRNHVAALARSASRRCAALSRRIEALAQAVEEQNRHEVDFTIGVVDRELDSLWDAIDEVLSEAPRARCKPCEARAGR